MKRTIKVVLSIALVVVVIIAPLSNIASAHNDRFIQINLAGKILDLPYYPEIKSGTILVPMRAIFEALGAEVKWDAKSRTVKGVKGGVTVELTIDSKVVKKNGKTSTLAVAPQIFMDHTMVPVRYVSESLDMHVAWIPSELQVYIDKDREIEGTTMKSVVALYDKYAPTYTGNRFIEEPSYSPPYKPGKLADGFLQDGLNGVNFIRTLVGLPTVGLSKEYTEEASYGALLMHLANEISPTPKRPKGISDELYKRGINATSISNLSNFSGQNTTIELFLAVQRLSTNVGDEELKNRRNVLMPQLSDVGFGYESFGRDANGLWLRTLMYSTVDKTKSVDYDIITYPSKGYFPVEWTSLDMKFNVTLNPSKYKNPVNGQVHGKITNKTEGTSFDLVPNETEGFNVVNSKSKDLDSPPTIVFYPTNDRRYTKCANAGDEFEIELEGIYKADGTPTSLKYTVKYFAMK